MTEPRVKFTDDTKSDPQEITPDMAAKLYDEGGFILVRHMPVGSEFGIDLHSWNTGPKFVGIKMVPPGLHFIYYSSVSNEKQLGPRTGFFHVFQRGEVLVKQWNKETESLQPEDSVNINKDQLRTLDSCLAPYPYQEKGGGWKKWISLSGRITAEELSRLQPENGPEICSVSQMESDEEHNQLSMVSNPEMRINFTPISRQKYPPGSSASEITRHNLDSSYQLQCFVNHLTSVDQVLVEMQFAFICFLVGQNYDSFEQWKKIVAMLCGCDQALLKYPQLFLNFISDLHFQMAEVPDDFFVDIVSQNNFLVQSLTNLFANIKSHENGLVDLKKRAVRFENNLTKKFGWSFDEEEDEECAPVIV